VNKLINVTFMREVKCPTWIVDIVPVRKKNDQLYICMDFWGLNDAYLKDDFLLPVTELMIGATPIHKVLSFRDCIVGYNQTKMLLAD